MRYGSGVPQFDGHIPKPVRKKKRSGDAWRRAKIKENPDGTVTIEQSHNDVLNACIDLVEAYGFEYLHVPDELYQLIAIYNPARPNDLAGVFERAIGYKRAIVLKKLLADAFKSWGDLIVFGHGDTYLCGDVKVGRDKFNHGQQAKAARMVVHEWRSLESFQKDFLKFVQQGIDTKNNRSYITNHDNDKQPKRSSGSEEDDAASAGAAHRDNSDGDQPV